MYPYPSQQFEQAISTDHNVAVKVEVWKGGATGPSLVIEHVNDGPLTTTPSVLLVDGSVTMDKSQDQRSQCQVELVSPDESYIPKLPTDLLTPWGNELRIYRGVYYPVENRAEYVPLGVFRITMVEVSESQGVPTITVTGYDRSRNISRNVVPFYWPDRVTQQLLVDKPWSNWIQVACSDRWNAVQFNDTWENWAELQNDLLNGSIRQGYQTFSEGTDLWSQSRQYAQAAGCELYFYREGVCYFRRDPNFSNQSQGPYTPVAIFTEGETATFDQVKRTLDDANTYNQVIVFGEGTILGLPLFTYPPNGQPAIDDDPASPTYIGTQTIDGDGNYIYKNGSPYGVVTHTVTNNLLTSQAMIQDFANLQLALDIGAQESVAVPSMAVNPCIDIDDLIQVVRPRVGAGKYGYIVNQITIPLKATGVMSMTLREKRQLSFGNIAGIPAKPQGRRNFTHGVAKITVSSTTSTTGVASIYHPHTDITGVATVSVPSPMYQYSTGVAHIEGQASSYVLGFARIS